MTDTLRQSEIAQRLGLRLSRSALPAPALPRIQQIKHLSRVGQIRSLSGRGPGGSQLWVLVVKMHTDQTADVIPVQLGFEEATSVDLVILTEGSTVGEVVTAWPAILATVYCDDLEGGNDKLVGYVTAEVLSTLARATRLGTDPRTLDLPSGLMPGPRATNPSWLLRLREETIECLRQMSAGASWSEVGTECVLSTLDAAFCQGAPRAAEILIADWMSGAAALSRSDLRTLDRRINRKFKSIRAADFFANEPLEKSMLERLPDVVRVFGTQAEVPRIMTKQLSAETTAIFELVGTR